MVFSVIGNSIISKNKIQFSKENIGFSHKLIYFVKVLNNMCLYPNPPPTNTLLLFLPTHYPNTVQTQVHRSP
jgi:hypothetical protein